jgi:plasmid maintenance system antidote protein VapI
MFALCELWGMQNTILEIDDLRAGDLVGRIGVSRSYASELLSGKRTPSLGLAVKIEREFGISPSAWPRTRRTAEVLDQQDAPAQ